MRPLHRLIASWMLVGLYTGGIFVLSSLSNPPLASTWDLPHLDKLYHTLEYSGLTFFLMRALCLTCPTRPSTVLSLWRVVLAVGYGALDDFHQAFIPDRMMSLLDIFSDAIGAGVAASTWPFIQCHWPILMS
jgi:VanZ family protein